LAARIELLVKLAANPSPLLDVLYFGEALGELKLPLATCEID
jgi:hypothetical protein